MVENNVVTAYYTFRKASSAPVLGMTVSGTVSSGGDASADIFLQLIRQGAPEADYETVVRGNTASYSFDAVDSGVYTLRVIKAGHVTGEYMVIVNAESVTQNVTLSLKGDMNLDGVVDMKDAAMLQRHVLKIDIAEDENALAVCELTGDGIVDMKDAAKLTRFVIKVIDSLD